MLRLPKSWSVPITAEASAMAATCPCHLGSEKTETLLTQKHGSLSMPDSRSVLITAKAVATAATCPCHLDSGESTRQRA